MSFRVRYIPNAPTKIAAKHILTDDDTYDFLPGGVLKIHTADDGWTFTSRQTCGTSWTLPTAMNPAAARNISAK
jgi:hypothetical protein